MTWGGKRGGKEFGRDAVSFSGRGIAVMGLRPKLIVELGSVPKQVPRSWTEEYLTVETSLLAHAKK